LSLVCLENRPPVVGHNRYWDDATPYAKQNGGQYEFIVEKDNGTAIPTEQAFWDFLMSSSKAWGLAVYEQDWLHNEWEKMDATLQSATLGREWLLQMGEGARKSALKVRPNSDPLLAVTVTLLALTII
jgi:hypothetical protein